MKKFFTSESVTEGHPDKVCDNISDGILDAILAQDPTFTISGPIPSPARTVIFFTMVLPHFSIEARRPPFVMIS